MVEVGVTVAESEIELVPDHVLDAVTETGAVLLVEPVIEVVPVGAPVLETDGAFDAEFETVFGAVTEFVMDWVG